MLKWGIVAKSRNQQCQRIRTMLSGGKDKEVAKSRVANRMPAKGKCQKKWWPRIVANKSSNSRSATSAVANTRNQPLGCRRMSSQFASNRMLQRRIPVMSFSVSSSLRSRPKMESTNSQPLFAPIATEAVLLLFLPASFFATRHMYSSHALRILPKRSQRRSPDSRKSSTRSWSSTWRMRGRHSSALLILPASWIKSNQRSPARSDKGLPGP